ncbi:MAG: hypothetical protein AAGG38_08615 [Planctomycetota bacterium]
MSSPGALQPEPDAASDRGRGRRWRRWVWRGGGTLLLLLLVPTAVGVYFTRPNQLRPLMEKVLSRELGGDMNIGGAHLSWGGELRLESLWLDVPGLGEERDEFAKLFEARRLTVQFDFSRLWRGELKVEDIRADRPRLHIIEDLDRGQLNLEMLRLAEDDQGVEEAFKLTLPPSILIKGARVRFAQVKDGRFKTLDAMRLEGELHESPLRRSLYDFALRQYDEEANLDATLKGSLDADAPELRLSLEGFRVDTAHRQLVPAGFRKLWDALHPTGRLPNLTVVMDANEHSRLRLKEAVLELADVSITPPYAELGRPPIENEDGQPYAPRMDEVSGRFVVTRDSVEVQDLTGVIEGIRYHASGRWGFAAGAAGSMSVSTDPFVLDENPKFLASLPMVGVQIFKRLSPSGRFQASTVFSREAGQPVEASGTVKLLGARGRYHKFPFPIHDMHGLIRFNRDRVAIENLTGVGPHGGTVSIGGEIAPPADGAAVRIAVAVRQVPFDELVMDAFSPKRRKGVELFFDPERYRELVAEGVVRPAPGTPPGNTPGHTPGNIPGSPPGTDRGSLPGPEAEDADLPPVFELGGPVDLDVLVDRGYGQDADYSITTTIQAAGARALFRHWPYPLVGESGQIVATETGIELHDVVVNGPTGGRGVLRGGLTLGGKGQPVVPDVRIEETRLPIDKLLIHSIRTPQRRLVADLHPSGWLVGGATVTRPDLDDDTQWRVDATIRDGVAQPFGGAYRLMRVGGSFGLGNDGLQLREVTGERGDASFAVSGEFGWGDRADAGFGLDIRGREVPIEVALLDLLPPGAAVREKLAALEETYRPAGVTDVKLRWESAPEAESPEPSASATALQAPALAPPGVASSGHDVLPPSTYRLELEPRTLSLDYRDTRLVFSGMAGRATFTPGMVDLDRLSVAFDQGTSTLDGLVGFDQVTPTALTFNATANAQCPYTRLFLPDAAVAAIDQLRVAGDYRLTDARLLRRPQPGPGQANLELDAKVDLIDTSLVLGLPITELNGTLIVGVRQHDDQRRPDLSFNLRADRLRALDRRVSPLTLRLNNQDDPDRLTFDPLLAGVYGGVLVGSGEVPLDPDGWYRFDLALSDAQVEPFLKPEVHDPTHRGRPDLVLAAQPQGAAPVAPAAPPRTRFSNVQRDVGQGRLSASLSIESPLNDNTLRRGRGALLIADAKLFDKPLSNAVLRASNLSLPSGEPLNTARARYLIDGETVRFDELSFSGPALTVAGAGTMTLPATDLNLVMVSRNTAAPRLGPVSDLINLFKDELIAIRVTGPLANPKTSVTSLRGFQRGWQDLFGAKQASPTPADHLVAP